VNEAGRSTQPSYISAPTGLEADPDGEAADTVSDNGSMSSRTRSGSSRSGAARRAGGANSASSTETADKAQDVTTSDKATPLPSETVGQASGTSRPTTENAAGNGQAEPAKEDTADKNDRQPVFTPATPLATSPSARPETTTAAPTARPGSSYSAPTYSGSPSYSGPGSSYPGSGSAYSASGTGTAYPGGPGSAGYPGSERPNGPGPATATTAAPGTADGASGASGSSPGGAFSSVNGFSTGAASAVSGAASGFASSVASVFKRGPKGDGSPRPQVSRRPARRQAMLTLSRVEPWSVMKFSFVASVVAFVILFVAVAVLYMVLSALGVFDSLQNTVSSITSSKSDAGTNISHWFSPSLILGYTAMLGALNIVLITAMSTVGSVIYNLIAKTIGGVEVTLRETD
jgi:Transmembrane domain of unknown function (DUF3566)